MEVPRKSPSIQRLLEQSRATAINFEGNWATMTTRIWIEPVKRPDGRNWYTERWGLLMRTRLGGPDGEILCDRVHNPICESCRALMARGILGQFETLKPGFPYPCMTAISRALQD